ncbi:Ger(x)C family spore germination protein [Lysinibacillus sp. NPDC047702]|uniref:Ger(x)C family spore germination protein n=1 Tax=unclassified Lysinibacillus TaxID=2636778 RepID=UPI003CFBCA29
MNKRSLSSLSLLVMSTLLLSGCWDVTEPQRMYYINAIGVDFKDNQYEVYMQILNLDAVAKSEQPNPDVTPSEVGFAKGRTIEEAIYKLYRASDQQIFWGHMRYLIFSENALKNERSIPVMDTFIRFRETRYHIWVYSTKDPIKEILLITPILKGTLTSSKLSNPINTTEQESFILPQNLREIMIGLNEPNHEVSIPYVTIKKDWETSIKSEQETTFSGVGVLSKDGLKGFIKDSAARGNQWMHNKTNRGEVTFKLESDERDFLTVDIDKLNVSVKPIVKSKNQVTFDIEIKLNATLNGFKGKVVSHQIREDIIKQVKKEVMETYEEGLKIDTDIYRLSEYLYRKNVKVWKNLEKDGKIPLTKDSISKLSIHVNKINPGRKTFAETIKE